MILRITITGKNNDYDDYNESNSENGIILVYVKIYKDLGGVLYVCCCQS